MTADESPHYFAFTTCADSLVIFEDGKLMIITKSGGEVTLTLAELKEILADLKRRDVLSSLAPLLLSD